MAMLVYQRVSKYQLSFSWDDEFFGRCNVDVLFNLKLNLFVNKMFGYIV